MKVSGKAVKEGDIAQKEDISAEAAICQKTKHSSTGTLFQNILCNSKYAQKNRIITFPGAMAAKYPKRIPVSLNRERNLTWIVCKQKIAEREAVLISSKLSVPQKFEDTQFQTIEKLFEKIKK